MSNEKVVVYGVEVNWCTEQEVSSKRKDL